MDDGLKISSRKMEAKTGNRIFIRKFAHQNQK